MKPNNERAKMEDSKRQTSLIIAAGITLSLWLVGCAGQNVLERDFGYANAHNIAVQTVNPQAGMTMATPTVGLPPKVGVNAMERYDKSFKPEEKAGTQLRMISGY